VCGNPARTDLCGGRLATAVPTAIVRRDHGDIHDRQPVAFSDELSSAAVAIVVSLVISANKVLEHQLLGLLAPSRWEAIKSPSPVHEETHAYDHTYHWRASRLPHDAR
jgi:hypothetical protein